MVKKGLHPVWYETKVFCDGKFLFTVGSTKEQLLVDVWSGNHPFYTGAQRILDTEGRVEKFEQKYQLKGKKNKDLKK